MNNYNINSTNKDLINEDDFDLRLFSSFLLRNRKIISLFTFIGIFFAYVVSKSVDKVWQGQFQIVLDIKNKDSRASMTNSSILGGFAGFLNMGNSSDSLETQVSILKSPSVLEPIYNFVYLEKNKVNFDPKKSNFSNWLNSNLDIELEDGTAVLNIAYRDKNKEIILPVLNKISQTYQLYSGKAKRRNFKLTKDYLNNQIEIYKKRSSNSLKIVQDYAIDQDLTLLTKMQVTPNTDQNIINRISNLGTSENRSNRMVSTTNSLIKNIDIENIRVEAANRIRNIESQIEKIQKIEDTEQLLYLSSLNSSNTKLLKKIEDLNILIVELKLKYTEKEKSISKLEEQKQLLIKQQKISLLNSLKAQKLTEEARMEAAERPKGVLLRYKELIRDADRDENILIALENELRAVTLEEAKIEDPWELITVPTLDKFPVKPERNKIRIFGLFIGLIFGALIAYIKEKRSNLIFDTKYLENSFNSKVLLNRDSLNGISSRQNIKIIQDILNVNEDKKIVFFTVGLVDEIMMRNFKSLLSDNNNIFFEDDLYKSRKDEIYFLLTSLNKITEKEVEAVTTRISILDIKISSLILL